MAPGAYVDPDPIATRVRLGTAVECGGDVWEVQSTVDRAGGFEAVDAVALGHAGLTRPLWRAKTRTPAQWAWDQTRDTRHTPSGCFDNQLYVVTALHPDKDGVSVPTLVIMVDALANEQTP